MITLKMQLEEYKETILKLMESVKQDGELPDLLLKKQKKILKDIKKSGYDKEEIKRNLKELNIVPLENELELTIKKEMVNIKKKIENIRTAKVARENYRNLRNSGITLFRGRA